MPKSRGGREPALRGALDDELIALLRLRALPGIGDKNGHTLIQRHGSASAVLRAPAAELGAGAAAARDSLRVRGWIGRALRVIDELGIHVIPRGAERYPARFEALEYPPLVLFARGHVALLDAMALAVVGTRQATEYGCDATRMLVGPVARAGVTIVSGLARGIDGAAHMAALECGGATIAVLGAGVDVPYPREHAPLHEQIARDGLLLSEFLPGTPVQAAHFVRRNRIIAALARAVLVVEAPQRSGALTTVKHALELGMDVLAVPGPIGRPSCIGTNDLIRDGATLATEPRDIFDVLGISEPRARPPTDATAGDDDAERIRRAYRDAGNRHLRWACDHQEASGDDARVRVPPLDPPPRDPQAAAVWRALGPDALHVDAIAARAVMPPAVVAATLLQLELDGRALRSAGMMYRRVR
jgi:DNA processing protein